MHPVVQRRDAIQHAIKSANAKDAILIAGKGHETYQEIKGVRYPFSDADEALIALAARSLSNQNVYEVHHVGQ